MEDIPLWYWLIVFFVFGACVGSFYNVIVYRMPGNFVDQPAVSLSLVQKTYSHLLESSHCRLAYSEREDCLLS